MLWLCCCGFVAVAVAVLLLPCCCGRVAVAVAVLLVLCCCCRVAVAVLLLLCCCGHGAVAAAVLLLLCSCSGRLAYYKFVAQAWPGLLAILAEGAIALSVTHSGGVLFAS